MIEITDKTLEACLEQASQQLNKPRPQIGYKILEESKGVIFGLGKKTRLQAWDKNSQDHVDHIQEEMRTFLRPLLEKFVGQSLDLQSSIKGDRLIFDAKNDNLERHFQRNTKIAEAFEHLTRKVVRDARSDFKYRVFVDSGGVRLRREKNLANIAKQKATQVIEQNEPMTLEYRSPYDRKIIHMALDQDDRVETRSFGDGNNRKLMILPAGFQDEQNPS